MCKVVSIGDSVNLISPADNDPFSIGISRSKLGLTFNKPSTWVRIFRAWASSEPYTVLASITDVTAFICSLLPDKILLEINSNIKEIDRLIERFRYKEVILYDGKPECLGIIDRLIERFRYKEVILYDGKPECLCIMSLVTS